MFHSIRTRLVGSYILLALLAVSLVGILTLTLAQRYVSQQERAFLRANAEAVARQAEPFLTPFLQRAQVEQLARTSAFLGDAQVRVLDAQGREIADSGDPAAMSNLTWVVQSALVQGAPGVFAAIPFVSLDAVPAAEELLPEQAGQPQVRYYVVQRDTPYGRRLYFVAQVEEQPPPENIQQIVGDAPEETRSDTVVRAPIQRGEQTIGFVEMSNGRSFGQESLVAMRDAFLIAAVGVILLSIFVGLLVGRGLSAPLRALTTTAGRMGGGDLSARAAEGRKDEIGALSSQFNRMATQLERSFQELQAERDALRNFIADASHEMRTPLTALRNFVELLQGPASQDAEAQAEFLKESEVQLNRLTWITENLLDLSRLDAGLIDLRPETLALGPWIDEVVSGLEPQASLRAIELVVDVADGLQWTFDSNRLGMALSNLVENAIKFSPRGGKVRVEAVQEEANLRIRVEDEGPGISPDDLPHIFSRFYRGEGTEVSGSGLGLSIVQSIVRAHGGGVEVTTEPGQPTRFEIVLPG